MCCCRWADALEAADAALSARLDRSVIEGIVAQVPDAWLSQPDAFGDAPASVPPMSPTCCNGFSNAHAFVQEALRARA